MHRMRGQLMPWKNGWLLISCAPWCEPSLIIGSRVNKALMNCLASMLTCNKAPNQARKSRLSLCILIGHLDVSSGALDADLRTGTKTHVFKRE